MTKIDLKKCNSTFEFKDMKTGESVYLIGSEKATDIFMEKMDSVFRDLYKTEAALKECTKEKKGLP